MYTRFVHQRKSAGQASREGFFCTAYTLLDTPELDPEIACQIEDLLGWFRENLPIPSKFDKTKSKGFYRRETKGLSWFKETADAPLAKSYELVTLLSECGYRIDTLRAKRVGYVVYEDEYQVVAEPFSDTPK